MKTLLAALLVLVTGCSACATSTPGANLTPNTEGDLLSAGAVPPDNGLINEDQCGGLWWDHMPLRVGITPDAEALFGQEIRDAIAWWGPQLLKFVEPGTDANPTIVDVIVHIDPTIKNMAWTLPHSNPLTCQVQAALIGLPLEMPMIVRHEMIAHELGHALGLDHDPARPESIMYPTADGGPFIALPEDRERLRKKYLGAAVCEPVSPQSH